MDAVQLADINEGTGLEFGVVAEKNNLFAGLDIFAFLYLYHQLYN